MRSVKVRFRVVLALLFVSAAAHGHVALESPWRETLAGAAAAPPLVQPAAALPPSPRMPAQSGEWRTVWADEFDVAGLPDPARWTYEVGGGGWGNNELQFYTARRAENARVENGVLIIEARREPWEGRSYTSARLNSRASWHYGRFEVRARLPRGRGTWPAAWMLPVRGRYGKGGWPDNGEIDIMEHVGFAPGVVHGTVHTAAYNHVRRTHRGGTIQLPDAQDAFHVYAVEWTPEALTFLADGTRYFEFRNERLTSGTAGWAEWPFDQEFRILLNVAVGGNWGGQKGVDEDIWPQRLEVDYVRVLERAPL